MDIVKRRLSQYGAAWVGSFLIVLVVALAAVFLLGMEVVAVADLLLPVALAALALAVIVAVVMAFTAQGPLGPKLLVLLLAIVLALPLLWAPVLAVVVSARLIDTPIEYSEAYAWFRITVSNALYPLVSAVVSGAAFRWVWEMFQIFATIIGAIASAIQVWNFARKLFAPAPVEA